jgi:hypothetical protein
VAPGVEIIACCDDIAVERAAARAIEQCQRIEHMAEFGRHLAQPDQIAAFGQAPQRRRQSAPERARRGSVARTPGAKQRRIVVGERKIGEFDDPDALMRAADQRQQRG